MSECDGGLQSFSGSTDAARFPWRAPRFSNSALLPPATGNGSPPMVQPRHSSDFLKHTFYYSVFVRQTLNRREKKDPATLGLARFFITQYLPCVCSLQSATGNPSAVPRSQSLTTPSIIGANSSRKQDTKTVTSFQPRCLLNTGGS